MSDEYKKGYEQGIYDFYQYVLKTTANHWHARKEIDLQCHKENMFAEDTAENAFMWLAPERFDQFEKELEQLKLDKPQINI